jgi:molybdopterin-binding protein
MRPFTRNQLKGTITDVDLGSVMAIVAIGVD